MKFGLDLQLSCMTLSTFNFVTLQHQASNIERFPNIHFSPVKLIVLV